MATWFYLPALLEEVLGYEARRQALYRLPASVKMPLWRSALYRADGEPAIRLCSVSVSLADSLAPFMRCGWIRLREPRLIVHIEDPLLGDHFVPFSAVEENATDWPGEAIARLREKLPA